MTQRAHKRTASTVTHIEQASGLGAALKLADERASVVVLQAGCGWSNALPRALAGQQAVFILQQQPEESLAALQARVSARVRSAEFPPQQVLWATPACETQSTLETLQRLLKAASPHALEVSFLSFPSNSERTANSERPSGVHLSLAGVAPGKVRDAETPSCVTWTRPEPCDDHEVARHSA